MHPLVQSVLFGVLRKLLMVVTDQWVSGLRPGRKTNLKGFFVQEGSEQKTQENGFTVKPTHKFVQ